MKKLLLLALTFCFATYAQKKQDNELMYMVLENFTYTPNTSKLKFDLVLKNNSDKTLYFIKPKNFFFSNHNDNGYLENTYNLYSKPYYIQITPYKNCSNLEEVITEVAVAESVKEAVEEAESGIETVEIEEVEETVGAVAESAVDAVKDDKHEYEDTVIESTEPQNVTEAVAYVHSKTYKVIEEIVEIPARKYIKFKNIEIDRKYSSFCKDVNYKITVDYYSNINPFDYYSIKIYKEYLKNNNTEAINTLFENEFKLLKKDGISNKENLQNILKIYDGIIETNRTRFFSNTIENKIN